MNRLTKIKDENKDWPYLRVVAGAQLTLDMVFLPEPIKDDVVFGKDGIIVNHISDNIQYDYPNTIIISGFPLKVDTNIAEFVDSYFSSDKTNEENNEETDEIINKAINEFLNNNKVDSVDGNIYDIIDNNMSICDGYILSEKGRNFSISITGAESDRYLISVDGIVVRNQPILLEGENPVTVLKEFVDSYFSSEFIDSDNDSMNVTMVTYNSGYIFSEKGCIFSTSITGVESDGYLICPDGIAVRTQPILLEGKNPVTVLTEAGRFSLNVDDFTNFKVVSSEIDIIDIKEGRYAIIDNDSHSIRTISCVLHGPRLELIGKFLFAPLEKFIVNASEGYTIITDKDVITLKPGSGFPIKVNYTNGDETSNQITEYKFDEYNVFIEGLTFMYDYELKTLYYKNEVVTDINVYNNIVIINKNKVVMKNGKEHKL